MTMLYTVGNLNSMKYEDWEALFGKIIGLSLIIKRFNKGSNFLDVDHSAVGVLQIVIHRTLFETNLNQQYVIFDRDQIFNKLSLSCIDG